MTQKEKIYNYLKEHRVWFKSYELQGKALEFGASPATVDRRLRDLYKEGSVERRRVGKYEHYRIKQARPSFNPNEYLKTLEREEKIDQEELFDADEHLQYEDKGRSIYGY